MLRHCLQHGRRQHRHGRCPRPWSSFPLPPSSPADDDDARAPGGRGGAPRRPPPRRRLATMAASAPPPAPTHRLLPRARRLSISRHPDPLVRHGTLNTVDDDEGAAGGAAPLLPRPPSADELELGDGGDAAGGLWDDMGGDGEDGEDGGSLWASGGNDDYGDIFGESGAHAAAVEAEDQNEDRIRQAAEAVIHAELDARTGRLWDDEWTITDEEWSSPDNFDDLEDWRPGLATRKSLESVRTCAGGVPTLAEMAGLVVPRALPHHPGDRDPARWAKFRKREVTRRLRTSIQLCVHADLTKILGMEAWEEKQAAVDALFEAVGEKVAAREPVLAKQPDFEDLVEKGLEYVLRMVHEKGNGAKKEQRKREARERHTAAGRKDGGAGGEGGGEEVDEGEGGGADAAPTAEDVVDVMGVNKPLPTPIFMDILAIAKQGQEPADADADADAAAPPRPALAPFFAGADDDGVPRLLYPLKVHPGDGAGRMVEEWQLAAHKETKRIMVREPLRGIAEAVAGALRCCEGEAAEAGEKGAARVFVAGQRGVGKTAALAALVASARVSGHIVVYLPDGDRLRRHGYYIEPDVRRPGVWNLPEIGKELCGELLTSHGDDLRGMTVAATREAMAPYLTPDQVRRAFKRAHAGDEALTEEEVQEQTELSLEQLLEVGIGSSSLSNGAYATVMSLLMNQTERPFTVVMDEFNCYFDHGHYFHMDYDENVTRAVPPNRIAVFKPFMDAMGLYPAEAGTAISARYGEEGGGATPAGEALMKWGAVIVGTSESRAVKSSFTRALEEAARAQSAAPSPSAGEEDAPLQRGPPPIHVVDVQRFNSMEVQHILYNFEITGVGRLRFDRGNTALNPEEVEYLRLVSGGLGQRLMDSCMIRM